MRIAAAVLVASLVAACSTVSAPPAGLLDDTSFGHPSQRISADDIFAPSAEMKHYIATEIADDVRIKGPEQGLFDALYSRNQLQLDYESAMTRNAAQAFAARAGNCLSLVIMTAAFAKEMGLTVTYNHIYTEDAWSRTGDIYLSIGHVNLTLGLRSSDGYRGGDKLTIDFLPPGDIRGLRSRPISEQTIIAMYMNNRAVESLAVGRQSDAYWWAREAIVQDPSLTMSYNTLGAIYQRHGDLSQAERALRYALERDPKNTHVMSNLVGVLNEQGRTAEANVLAGKLAELEPNPPFSYFNRGMNALRAGDYKVAKEMFTKETERAPYYHEFHFWLAVAALGLGDRDLARKHLEIAIEASPTRSDHDLYAAKLDKINASHAR